MLKQKGFTKIFQLRLRDSEDLLLVRHNYSSSQYNFIIRTGLIHFYVFNAYNNFQSMKNSHYFCLPTQLYSSQTLEQAYPLTTIHYMESYEKQYNESHRQPESVSPLHTLSIKKLRPSFDISFQKDFHKEHLSTFYGSFRNYKEYLRKHNYQISKTSELGQIQTRSDLENPKISSLLEQASFSLQKSQRRQFLKDLLYEQKLQEFLEEIVRTLSPEESIKFILMTHKIWLQYVPYQRQQLQAEDMMKLGKQITHKTLLPQFKSSFIEKEETSKEINETLIKFFDVYSITILLILGEFFQNPFYVEQTDIEAPKRALNKALLSQLSDSEDEYLENEYIDPLPEKKQKSDI